MSMSTLRVDAADCGHGRQQRVEGRVLPTE